jgi:phosphoethanolamine N-methyltransferase
MSLGLASKRCLQHDKLGNPMTPSNSPEEGASEAYSDGEVGSLELIWGAGYLSPGGPDAVARIIRDVPVAEKVVLDLGCGIGGPAIALVEVHRAKHVTGIDIVPRNLERAASAVATAGLADRIALRLVEPGPLPFADATFDVVFSKDALVEAPDKAFLFAEAWRILRPGGWLVASDWLRADGPVSPQLQQWIEFSGSQETPHSFHLASPSETRSTLEALGYADIRIADENDWYRQEARREVALKEQHFPQFVALRGQRDAEQSILWHRAMIAVLDSGDFRPASFMALKA